jgi:hypothetical protein
MPMTPNPCRTPILLSAITAAGHRPGAGAAYFARFVKAGAILLADRQESDIHLRPAALQSAARRDLFDHRAVFIDHAGWFSNPSLEKLAGKTRNARYDPATDSILGEIVFNDTPSGALARQIIDEILGDNHPADIGLSISFYPIWEGQDISDIRHVESVDLVFQPAADGRILAALSSSLPQVEPAGGFCREPLPTLSQRANPQPKGVTTTIMSQTAQFTPQPPGPDPADLVTAWTDAAAHAPAQGSAQASARQIIAASGLPEPARARLSAQAWNTPQDLQNAIEAERSYLAELSAQNVIQIGAAAPRSSQISNMRTSLDSIGLALEALLSGTRPPDGVMPLTGVRELYHLLSGDYEMSGMFNAERLQLANVNSSTMANMVANVLNKRLAQEFQTYPMWWAPIVNEEDFQSLQAIQWTLLGGIGELPTVAEGATYTELTWDDSKETGTFYKKGGYLGLTLEAIDKDETGRLRGAPRALAQAAWLTLSKSISSIFTQASGAGPNLTDGTALFHSTRGNAGTTALSITAWNAARTAMRKFAELNSGERLGGLVVPRYLLVPPDLEITATQILASEYEYTYALSNGTAAPVNPNAEGNDFGARMAAARSRVVVVDLWTDTNDWAAVCDPRLYPTIGVGYRYGRQPEIFSVASPTAGLMFTNDTMPIKVRFFYAVAPIDWRGMYKANVA